MLLTSRPTLRVVRRTLPRIRRLVTTGPSWMQCGLARGAEAGFALGEVVADGGGGFVAERNEALLATLAADEDGVILPVDVGEVDADEFGVADAASIEEFEDHTVALGPRGGFILRARARGWIHGVEQAVDLFHARDAREMFGQLGRADEQCRILGDAMFAGEPAEPRTDCGEGTGGRGLGEVAFVQDAEVRPDVEVLDGGRGYVRAEGVGEVGYEVLEFAAIGAEGVGRGVPLYFEHAQEVFCIASERAGRCGHSSVRGKAAGASPPFPATRRPRG